MTCQHFTRALSPADLFYLEVSLVHVLHQTRRVLVPDITNYVYHLGLSIDPKEGLGDADYKTPDFAWHEIFACTRLQYLPFRFMNLSNP